MAGIGMPLFFVLSGFVIHYNYADKLADRPITGTYNFFVARFARLYPLYIVCLSYDWLYSYSYSQWPDYGSSAIPYYLTMTQTWVYQIVGGHSLVYTFGVIPQVSWSISTEWFFYCVYPLICLGLYRMRRVTTVLISAVLIIVGYVALLHLAWQLRFAIDDWAIARYGQVAADVNIQESFTRWLRYFSPYSQIPNFVLGCLVAELHNKLRSPPSRREQQLGLALMVASIVYMVPMFVLMYDLDLRMLVPVLNDSFVFGPALALLIFCCARYWNPIVKALTARWMVFCGEASYSIYMLHLLVITAFRWETAKVTDLRVALGVNLRLAVVLLTIVGLAHVTYSIIEVPGRRILAGLLSIRSQPLPQGYRAP